MSLFTVGCVGVIGVCVLGIADCLFFNKNKSNDVSESTKVQYLGGMSIDDLLSEEHEIDMEVLKGGK